jgi:hypothetical protein
MIQFTHDKFNGLPVLIVSGALNYDTAPILKGRITDSTLILVLDTESIDVNGFTCLRGIQARLNELNGRLYIVLGSVEARRRFDITGCRGFFGAVDSLDDLPLVPDVREVATVFGGAA